MPIPRPICGYTDTIGIERRVCDRVAIHRGVRDVPRCDGHKDEPCTIPCPSCAHRNEASKECPLCWGTSKVTYERDPVTGETRRKPVY